METIARASGFALLAGLVVLATMTAGSCSSESDSKSRAYRVTSRTQLIGGPTALGEVGDFMLENDKIRVVVQDKTYNRGSGVFGGSLIDADLARHKPGNALGGKGRDTFGELFPVFFLEMIDPENIDVINDGSDGKAAIVEVKGRGGEFITMLRYLNQVMINSYPVDLADVLNGVPANSNGEPQVEFRTRYILEPGTSHIRIESTLTNISFTTLEFPSDTIKTVVQTLIGLDLDGFRIPTGHVLGFGKKSHIFIPGVGYDLRFGLDESYQTAVPLPGFPGLLTNVVASSTDLGVNYGFATVEDPENNFVYQRDQDGGLYGGDAQPDDLLFLFYASGFGGVFSSQGPETMAPNFCNGGESADAVCGQLSGADANACRDEWDNCKAAQGDASPSSYTFTNYFIIGDGDVASIYEELYRIKNIKTTKVIGRVFDRVTRETAGDLDMLFYTTNGSDCSGTTIVNQVHVPSGGTFQLEMVPGDYCYRVRGSGRPLSDYKYVKVGSDGAFIQAFAESTSYLQVQVVDSNGARVPAKVSVVGTHDYFPGQETRSFLFDLQAGESWRASDMIPDTEDPNTRRFLEQTAFTDHRGHVTMNVRPSDSYVVHVSRGPEYDVFTKEVSLKPGGVETVVAKIERTVDTTGYLAGDFHLHAAGSIDSGLELDRRIKSAAAEGLEIAVSTDHNYVTDYGPAIRQTQMEQFVNSTVGLELTTFEAGHFNAFPVARDLDSMSRGSIKWQEIPPQTIFNALRDMAPESGNIVQANHARTPILGYFYQHNVDAFDTTVDLAFNQAEGQDRITATLVSPTGPAFIETIYDENGEPLEYKSTFSWDFDAMEVFNGKHFEEIRHFRMPYDKTATDGPDVLPQDVFDGLKEQTAALYDTPEDFYAVVFPDLDEAQIMALSDTEIEEGVSAYVMDQIPNQGVILCDGDDVVFPGVLDDYYNILNFPRPDGSYKRYTATGNSDSHGDNLDEVGYPRNYFFAGKDRPRDYKDSDLVKAMREHRNIVTNGPFITMEIDGEPIGSELEASGSVTIKVHVAAADWVGTDRIRILQNGEVVRGLPGQNENAGGWLPIQLGEDGTYTEEFTVDVAADSWFVLEAEGDQNMFPVLTPQEIPPFNFDAVIGSLAGAFGFGGGVEGLEPALIFPQTPFAMTNPIWVIADGDGQFTPPEPEVFRCKDGAFVAANALMSLEDVRRLDQLRLKAAPMPVKIHGHENPFKRPVGTTTRDLRMIFENFGHQH